MKNISFFQSSRYFREYVELHRLLNKLSVAKDEYNLAEIEFESQTGLSAPTYVDFYDLFVSVPKSGLVPKFGRLK